LRDHAHEAASSGDLPSALGSLARLCSTPDGQAADAALQIALLRRTGKTREALEAADLASQKWPDDQIVWIEHANTLVAAGLFEQVLRMAETAAERGPKSAAAALEVRALHHLGRVEEAEQRVDALLAQGSAGPALLGAAVPVLMDQHRLSEAAELARHLAQDEFHAYPAWEALAADALNRDQVGEALGFVHHALAVRKDDGRVWLLSGLAHWQAQNAGDARHAIENAVRLMPEHAGSWLTLGWMHLLQGERALARASFERGVMASPSFSESHGSLAVLAAMEGRTAEADTLIRKACRLDPACGSAALAQAQLDGAGPQDIAELGKRFVDGLRAGLVQQR
jgi:tetratricopeptide (TPR) repeat protein